MSLHGRDRNADRWMVAGTMGEPRGPKTELRMSPEQTIRAVAPGGLKLAHVVEIPPYHYGAVFERSPPESEDAPPAGT
jgi:hypothetical protein